MSIELEDTAMRTAMSPPLSPPAAPCEAVIDEGLYSRQLYVLGFEAMRRMVNSNVLILGLRGLGVEVAKDVALAGVRSITLWDPHPATSADLSAQFFLNEGCIGRERAGGCAASISELNEYVLVRVLEGEWEGLQETVLSQFQVIVLCDASAEQRVQMSRMARQCKAVFICANVRGLFGSVFCDFGPSFVVTDTTGEAAASGIVSSISADGIVTCSDEARHGLESGDVVTFREVQGVEGLNGREWRVTVISPYSFSVDHFDAAGSDHKHATGVFEQVKQPQAIAFKTYEECLQRPEFVISDFGKIDRQGLLHELFNNLPTTSDCQGAETVAKEFQRQEAGYLAPMCAVIGGIVAQEVIKACTGKFHPIKQNFYFDALECLASKADTDNSCEDYHQVGSRYDPQIAVFGQSFQRTLASLQGFIVGAGAIGCELLKVMALMGVGSGKDGKLTITDMDTIEKSNLNRQFLFRAANVGRPKSQTAAVAVHKINPAVKIDPRVDRVGQETEHVFNDDFFQSLDFVANALDNVDARRYMDRRCVYFRKPLLESGTLGTKGNSQVVIPHLTESYSSSNDPPEKSIPFCTLHNFPNSIEHTIQWAMDLFHGTFKSDPETANRYLSDPSAFLSHHDLPQLKEQAEVVARVLHRRDRPSTYEDCIRWARLKFEELFANNIQQLLFNFPKDALTSTGGAFWSGPKRAPHALTFDPSNTTHLDFVRTAANLRAAVYNIKPLNECTLVKTVSASTAVPPFVPKSGVKIQVSEGEELSNNSPAPDVALEDIQRLLPRPADAGPKLNVLEFEKDDNTNHHIDFVAACANLRAENYDIAPADRHTVKGIAGKIIPAIATTTAMVAGLVCLELYKVAAKVTDLDAYKNFFANLALPFFAFSTPIAAPKCSYDNGASHWTLWDRFDIPQGRKMTLGQLLQHFEERHKFKVSMLSHGSSMLYGFIRKPEELHKRLAMTLPELVETISKKPLPPHTRAIVLEALAESIETGDDVDIPYIRVEL